MKSNEEYVKEARREFTKESFRSKLKEMLGEICVNCGGEDCIEYHHIVPIVYGGTNKLTNIVPLCINCHYKAHHKSNAEGIKKAKINGTIGRKHSVPYEICYPYIEDYIYGRIGKKEFKKKCGYSEKYKLDRCGYIEKYKKDNNIVAFRNIIDVITTNGKLLEGRRVGYILFDNGNKEELYYHKMA